MATFAVTVKSVVSGEPRRGAKLGDVRLELASERISVRGLIARAVERQIVALLEEARLDAEAVSLALRRQYLTQQEVESQAAKGRVKLRTSARAGVARLDARFEVERALRGFEARCFQILVDGRHVDELDELVTLTGRTKVTFLRLVPLAGG